MSDVNLSGVIFAALDACGITPLSGLRPSLAGGRAVLTVDIEPLRTPNQYVRLMSRLHAAELPCGVQHGTGEDGTEYLRLTIVPDTSLKG